VTQVDDPLRIGQSFFGAVMSEQAVRTTEAMMAVATSSLRRIIGVSPEGKGVLLTGQEQQYLSPPMPKWHFSIRKCLFSIKNSTFSIIYPSR
jgi:hypothetical protein